MPEHLWGVPSKNSNYRNRLARNSLFFANREFDNREQGFAVFKTAIFSRVIRETWKSGLGQHGR